MSEIKLFSLHTVSSTKMTEWAIPVHVSPMNDTVKKTVSSVPHRHLLPHHLTREGLTGDTEEP